MLKLKVGGASDALATVTTTTVASATIVTTATVTHEGTGQVRLDDCFFEARLNPSEQAEGELVF